MERYRRREQTRRQWRDALNAYAGGNLPKTMASRLIFGTVFVAVFAVIYLQAYLVLTKGNIYGQNDDVQTFAKNPRRIHQAWQWPRNSYVITDLKKKFEKVISRVVIPKGFAFSPKNPLSGKKKSTLVYTKETPIRWQMQPPGGPKGHERLPDFFYQGVSYGISAWDPYDGRTSETTGEKQAFNKKANRYLLEELRDRTQFPHQPTFIWNWTSYCEKTRRRVHGFFVHFDENDFQSYHSSSSRKGDDPTRPTGPHLDLAEKYILLHARMHGQAIVYKWFPHHYGELKGPDAYSVIIQRVLTTAAAVRGMKSSGPVWQV